MAFTVFQNTVSVIVLLVGFVWCRGRVGGRNDKCTVAALGPGGKPWQWAGNSSTVTWSYLLTVVKEEDLVLMEGAPPSEIDYPLFSINCTAAPHRWWATHKNKPIRSSQPLLPATQRLVPFSNLCLVRPIVQRLLKNLGMEITQPLQTSNSRIREYSADYCYSRLPVDTRTTVRTRLINNTRLAAHSSPKLWRNL